MYRARAASPSASRARGDKQLTSRALSSVPYLDLWQLWHLWDLERFQLVNYSAWPTGIDHVSGTLLAGKGSKKGLCKEET